MGGWGKERQEHCLLHPLSTRKLAKMTELASESTTRAKAQQKIWYDRNARDREFQPVEQVLMLLPTS